MNCLRFQWDLSFSSTLNASFDYTSKNRQQFVVTAVLLSVEKIGILIKSFAIDQNNAAIWVCPLGNQPIVRLDDINQALFDDFGLEPFIDVSLLALSSSMKLQNWNHSLINPLTDQDIVNDYEMSTKSFGGVMILSIEINEENSKKSILLDAVVVSRILTRTKAILLSLGYKILDIDVQDTFQPSFVSWLIKGSNETALLIKLIQDWIQGEEITFLTKSKMVVSKLSKEGNILDQSETRSGYTQSVPYQDNLSCLLSPNLESWWNLRKAYRLFAFEKTQNGFSKLSYRSMTRLIFNIDESKIEAIGILCVLQIGSNTYGLLQKRNPEMDYRSPEQDYWNVIAGHTERTDPTIIHTAFRETSEELGNFNPFGCSVHHSYMISFKKASGKRFVLFVLVLDPLKATHEWSELAFTKPNEEVDISYEPRLYLESNLFKPPNGYDWFNLANLPSGFKWGPKSDPELTARTIAQTLPFIQVCSPTIYQCFQ
jgi:8-oxo-dGTP pyrophosphatase MutT (NUDIX family)